VDVDDPAAGVPPAHAPDPLLAALHQAWGLAGPSVLVPLTFGTNNLAWRVQMPGGGYVLRLYANMNDLDRLCFEQSVLTRLEACGLPFATPAPIPTREGALCTEVVIEGRAVPATLTMLIPGAPAHRKNLDQARAAGEAIASLDHALATLSPPDAVEGTTWRSTGDLAHCHPLVPDPATAIRTLPLDELLRARLLEGYATLVSRIAVTYPRLEQHLQHEDTDPSNILMEGTRVTGVLDFEFCARDVRPMDLAIALTWWPVRIFGSGQEWPIMCALAAGYASRRTLTREEIEALPLLFLYRGYTSLIHRCGRYLQGLSSLDHVLARAEATIAREDWLRTNGERLIDEVGQAFGW
jgi:Ser/Thr protein kinase RdoA (MazF antagonist)